jgi:hypothetical protein
VLVLLAAFRSWVSLFEMVDSEQSSLLGGTAGRVEQVRMVYDPTKLEVLASVLSVSPLGPIASR